MVVAGFEYPGAPPFTNTFVPSGVTAIEYPPGACCAYLATHSRVPVAASYATVEKPSNPPPPQPHMLSPVTNTFDPSGLTARRVAVSRWSGSVLLWYAADHVLSPVRAATATVAKWPGSVVSYTLVPVE